MKKSFMFLFAVIGLFPRLCKANEETLWKKLRGVGPIPILFSFSKDKINQFENFFDNKIATHEIHTIEEAAKLIFDWMDEFNEIEANEEYPQRIRKMDKKLLKDTIAEKWDKECPVFANLESKEQSACNAFSKDFRAVHYYIIVPFIIKKIENAYPVLKKPLNEKKKNYFAEKSQSDFEKEYPFLKD